MSITTNHTPISLLKQIIAIPSLSGEEDLLSRFLENWLRSHGFIVNRKHNNLWVESIIDEKYPKILINSHMDTVKVVAGWTKDPYIPQEEGGKLYGLGCSDAGGSVVAMIFAFMKLAEIKDRNYNLVLLISAEEEKSGPKGITTALAEIGKIDLAIVGEPTDLDMAICERGLIVIDCFARGSAGHVAHKGGENAIYKALKDIEKIQKLSFPKSSELLGEVQMEVTQIEAGYQHNVIPDECRFVIDVRTNEHYTNQEVVDYLKKELESEITPRSLRLHSSSLSPDHSLVTKAKAMGIQTFGSKTMSDQALIPAPSVKLGPGKSELSHKADEHIVIEEIEKAIDLYYNLLKDFSV
ncbi:MAG: M20/M25/M40 family metallo-hydrolase [Bacteroidales bacterium]